MKQKYFEFVHREVLAEQRLRRFLKFEEPALADMNYLGPASRGGRQPR